MKRELAYLVDAHTPVYGSLGRTRSSKVRCREINIVSNSFNESESKRCHSGESNLNVSIDNSSLKVFGDVETNDISSNVEENVSIHVNSALEYDTIDGKSIPLRETTGYLKKPLDQVEPTSEFIEHPVVEGVSVESAIVVDDASAVNDIIEDDLIAGNSTPMLEQMGGLKTSVYQKVLTNEFIQHPVVEQISLDSPVDVLDVNDIAKQNLIDGESTPMHEWMDDFKKLDFQEEPTKLTQHPNVECAIVMDDVCDMEKQKAEWMEIDSKTERPMEQVNETENAQPITRPVIQFTRRTALEPKGLTAEASSLPKVSARRVTRSALKPMREPVEAASSLPEISAGRVTRSASKPMREPVEDVSKTHVEENIVLLHDDLGDSNNAKNMLQIDEDSVIMANKALRTLKMNLELKMSKKITVKKNRMSTLKELLETGLLEGKVVTYNFTGKELHGVIKGVGISCSCNSCKGCLVVSPTKFELHACNIKRNAAHYTCLENGMSLRQVIMACRDTSTDNLEATILKVVGSLPSRQPLICEDFLPVIDPLICQNCKVSFTEPPSSGENQLCNLCMNSETPQASTAIEPSIIQNSLHSRDPLICLNCKGSFTAPCSTEERQLCSLCINSEAPQTMTAMESSDSLPAIEPLICENCKGSFTAPCSSEKCKLCSLCKNSETPQTRITRKNGKRARSPELDLTSDSPETSVLSISSKSRSEWKITRKNFRLHTVVFGEGGLPDGTELAYYSLGKKILEGYKMGCGIFCFCCRSEQVSASIFEAHAGFKPRRKPYHNIYTSNGVSLHELAVSLSKGRKSRENKSDDLCTICHDGGDLVLCDACPRAFHKECASLTCIPTSEWYCKYCHSMYERESSIAHNANAVAAGRVSGVDPIEQITKRCIRIIKNPDASRLGGCALCRSHDFHKSGFGPRTVIICDQCEREFHVGCLKDNEIADLKELPKGKWFCCPDCARIHSILQRLLDCGAGKLPDSFLSAIRKKLGEEDSDSDKLDVRWRLLSGKLASPETKLLLSKAVAIFHDCFDAIVDPKTGRDLIPCMVYGRQEFAGMYCSILTVNSVVVSTGIIRIFGPDVAELPLAATCNGSHGKGYFQTLFSCVERLLGFLNIKSLVLPAAEEAGSIWIDKFAFNKIPPDQLCTYRRDCSQISSFKGTCMLQKAVPKFAGLRGNVN